MIPQFQFDKLLDSMDNIQSRANAKNIILNGDIKHNFANISKQEWKETLDFIDYLSDIFVDIKVIKGNHDNFTQYILNKRDLILEDEAIVGNYYVTHGHKIPEQIPDNIETIVIGHEHPSIGIRNQERVEKVKAFLKGRWNDYNLIVTPSFTEISHGSDVLHEKTISPFIKDVSKFEIYAIEEDEVFPFGLVEDILSVEQEDNIY
jgi:putative SbcD/Mre11-related phosphoesterase